MGKTVIFCVDTRGGMAFNNRRQIKDRQIIADLVKRFGSGGVFIGEYSARLFEGYDNVTVSADPIADCADGASCFIESPELLESISHCDTVVIYTWGLPYPADRFFEVDLVSLGFKRISKDKLATEIHNKVTREVYKLSLIHI